MRKKYLSALLFGALLFASAGTFTSCKDYDDDINELREQINGNQTTIGSIEEQLKSLQSAAQAAQSAADAAAQQAQSALEKADEAAAQAALAQQAAEEAKTEAIEQAKAELEAYKAEVEEALANKVDGTRFDTMAEELEALGADLQTKYAELVGMIEAIQPGLAGDLNGLELRIGANEGNIANLQDALATLTGGETDLEMQKAVLENYAQLLGENGLSAQLAEVQSDIAEINTTLTAVQGDIQTLKNDVLTNKTDIAGINTYINDTLKPKLQDIDNEIRDINSALSQLHVLIEARLSSITFAPNTFVEGVEAIVFNSLEYGDMKNFKETEDFVQTWEKTGEEWKAKENGNIPAAEFSTAALATASYHFNPSSFKLSNADYQYIDRQVEVITTRAAVEATDLLEIEGEPKYNVEDGTVDFQLRRLDTPNTSDGNALDKVNTVALQATLKGEALGENEAQNSTDVVVTSPYVRVYDAVVNQSELFISDKESLETVGDKAHFATTVIDAQREDEARYEVIYDEEFNLKELIATCVNKVKDPADLHNALDLDAYKLSYRFAVAETRYDAKSGNTTTNQQTVIECVDAEAGLYKVPEKVGRESIGRTPILRIELVDENGRVVRRAFVKVKVVTAQAEEWAPVVPYKFDMVYNCPDTEETAILNEEWMRTEVYQKIMNSDNEASMSHEEFWKTYKYTGVSYNTAWSGEAPKVVEGSTVDGTATKLIQWNFKHADLGAFGPDGTATIIATMEFTNMNGFSEYPKTVKVAIAIEARLPQINAEFVPNEIYWEKDAYGNLLAFRSNVNVPETPDAPGTDCIFETHLNDAFASVTLFNNDAETPCYKAYYRIADGTPDDIKAGIKLSQGAYQTQIISLDKSNNNIKKALNSEGGLNVGLEFVVEFDNGDKRVVRTLPVRFVTPLYLNMPVGLSLTDAKTGGDYINYSSNELFTDWRGYSVFAPDQEIESVDRPFWKKVCAPHFQVIPGWYEVVSAARWDVEFDIIHVDTGVDQLYSAEGKVTFWWNYTKISPDGMGTVSGTTTTTQEINIPADYLTASDAEAAFTAEIGNPNDYLPTNEQIGLEPGYGAVISFGGMTQNISTKEEQVNSVVDVKVIKDMVYVPADIKYHPSEMVETPCNKKPDYAGTEIGETVGCWQWTNRTESQIVDIPGAYWAFYGLDNDADLVFDLDNVKTSLTYNGGKLPNGVTLTVEGNKLKYVNVGTPVGESYTITVPVYRTYGWGVVKDELTFTVNPSIK